MPRQWYTFILELIVQTYKYSLLQHPKHKVQKFKRVKKFGTASHYAVACDNCLTVVNLHFNKS